MSESHPVPPAAHQVVATLLAPASVLSEPDGQLRGGGVQGFYVGDRRMLCAIALQLGGQEPVPLGHIAVGPGRSRFIGVLRELGDGGADPTVRVERYREVSSASLTETVQVSSVAGGPVRAELTVRLAADLATLEDVKNHRGGPIPSTVEADALVWSVDGVRLRVQGPGARLDPDGLSWALDLPPGGRVTLRWRASVTERRPVVVRPADPEAEWARLTVRAGDPRLDRLVRQSLDDLAALRLAEPGHRTDTFLAAGVPWFLTLFGRDSIWAARMLLPLGTRLAGGTLRTLARRQGRTVDPRSGEAPGKIMHELRARDIRLPAGSLLPATYYGTIDATPLWISLLHDAWRWGLPEAEVAGLLPALDAALGWLDGYADPDGDGFVEYRDVSGWGLANQGWKDSGGAMRYHDGRRAEPPIALCEVQGYAHRAALDAADLLDAFDRPGGERWRAYAHALAGRFRARFWVDGPRGRYPALALDRHKRPVDALTSNIGHLLGTGLLDAGETALVAAALARPELSDGFGLRTMSTGDAGYGPMSYHCGAIWPHDTALVAWGLARAGAHQPASMLIEGLLAAAEGFGYRLPEVYGGDPRASVPVPLPHPGACRPQAWSAAAVVTVLQAVLGLRADVPGGTLTVAPLAGAPLGPLAVRGLRIAGADIEVTAPVAGPVRVTGLPATIRLVTPAG